MTRAGRGWFVVPETPGTLCTGSTVGLPTAGQQASLPSFVHPTIAWMTWSVVALVAEGVYGRHTGTRKGRSLDETPPQMQ